MNRLCASESTFSGVGLVEAVAVKAALVEAVIVEAAIVEAVALAVLRSVRQQVAQLAEQVAIGMRRFVAQLFFLRIARELTQMLAIRVREFIDQRTERAIAFGHQAPAPALCTVQRGRLLTRSVAADIQRVADRFQRIIVFATHLFGQKMQLALVRDVRSDALGVVDMRPQRFRDWQSIKLMRREQRQLPRQFQYFQRVATLLASAWRQIVAGVRIFASHNA